MGGGSSSAGGRGGDNQAGTSIRGGARYGLLLLSLACTIVTAGNALVPVAAWIAPLFMLRFVRQSPASTGIVLGAAAYAIAHILAWDGVLPFHGPTFYAVAGGVGLLFFVPVAVDRLLAPRLDGIAATLVFPTAWVVVEHLFMQVGFGSWGAVAYSQYGQLPLLQLLSVTGLSGITFLTGWFASTTNAAWEGGWLARARRPLLVCIAVIAIVLAAGGLRLAFAVPDAPTVRIAGITVDNMDVFRNSWGPLSYGKPLTESAAEQARPQAQELQNKLLAHSRAEARAGAKIVVWTEGNALVFKQDEAAFIRAGQALARREGIYLFMAMATMTPGDALVENKVVLVDPEGHVDGSYLKSHPTPGEASIAGDGRVRVLQTPYGRLAWAICYDFDYPALIQQAGRAGADILIDPSWENAGMNPLHSQMAAYRAIENGAALFRPVNGGLGLAVDHHGRVLAARDDRSGKDSVKTLIADVPTRGARTIYSRTGDLVPLAAAGLLLLLGVGVLRRRAAW
jgi:apolipoprotein N-acyltransferase